MDPEVSSSAEKKELSKCKTGICGLDEITAGGLPEGRHALICGDPGCGKTVMAMEFIARGAGCFDDPGVYMAFEENERELRKNSAGRIAAAVPTPVRKIPPPLKKIIGDLPDTEKVLVELDIIPGQ